jgi:hypothetical protein
MQVFYVKPENLGFYASSTILKESKYDFTIEKLYPSALVNSITTQNNPSYMRLENRIL